MMGEGDEDRKLKNATINSLKVADENKLKSIAFPAISTGVYGYPMEDAAPIAVATVRDTVLRFPAIREVIFCCHSAADLALYESLLKQY
jgi:O-acetyl-ADP-ribose deacetylase (regulator of RNase III)